MKVLMTVPSFNVLGGVASHYMGLRRHWPMNVTYHTIGRRRHVPAIITFVPDMLLFLVRLVFGHYDTVLLNSSFKSHPIRRDALFLRICCWLKVPTAVFFHGWNSDVYEQVKTSPSDFVKSYNHARLIYVLYSGFARQLAEIGITAPIHLTTTKVSDEIVAGFDAAKRDGTISQILFLARADKEKGLDVAIRAFELVKKRYSHLRLSVCGDGDALREAKEYVTTHQLADVTFHGFVKGVEIIRNLKESQLYILPTTHGEGMATSVLEAMAMGLVVLTRPVGGVNDFFEQDKMGRLIESVDPVDYADAIIHYLEDLSLVRNTARYNHQYACEHFLASSIAKSMSEDLQRITTK